MEYIVSARKYRPATFGTVVGQRALTTTLLNAIRSGKLAHAYLFCGPRGVGKTTCARIFAKTINCLSPNENGEACCQCESCLSFEQGRSMNIHELDAASNNSVDDIRELIEQVRIPPQGGRYKVFIIDEVHMLSTQAFNAFLKTLEEPPSYVVFILATTEKHKILPTILSRCQVYDFARISLQSTIDHLQWVASQEGIQADPQALSLIARKSDGGMRDALSIFDQMASFCQGNITLQQTLDNLNMLSEEYYFRLTDHLMARQISEALLLLDEVLGKGFDGGNFVGGLATHMRNVLVAKDAVTLPLLEADEQTRKQFQQQAQRCPTPFLYGAIQLCSQCEAGYRQSRNKRLSVELCLIQVAQLQDGAGSGLRPEKKTLNLAFPDAATAAASNSQQPASPAAPASQATVAAQPVPASSTSSRPARERLHAVGAFRMSSLQPLQPSSSQPSSEEQPVSRPQASPSSPVSLQPAAPKLLTEDLLMQEWVRFATQLEATDPATSSRLLALRETLRVGDAQLGHFTVTSTNALLTEMLEKLCPQVEEAVARATGIAQPHMQVEEHIPELREMLSPLEQLNKLKNEYPHVNHLVEGLKLHL